MRKKIFLSLLMSIIIANLCNSQETHIPIQYSLSLFKQDTTKCSPFAMDFLYRESFLQDNKRNSKTIVHTKLDTTTLKKLFQNFVKHIETQKKVNHFQYTSYSTGIYKLTNWNVEELNNADLYQRYLNYYAYLQSEEMEWKDGAAYSQSYKNVVANSSFAYRCDTTQVQYPFPPYDYHDTVFCKDAGPSFTEGLGFVEIWKFNPQTGVFGKQIDFTTLKIFYSEFGTFGIPFLCFRSISQPNNATIIQNMQYDVFFDKWNSCNPYSGDMSECEDLVSIFGQYTETQNCIYAGDRTELLMGIFNAVEKGTLVPLDATQFAKGKEKSLTVDKMWGTMETKLKVTISDPLPPYKSRDTTVIQLEELSNIIGIRFIEDWSFEGETMNFYKKVKSFALLFAVYNQNTGELMGYKPYFFLKPKN